MNCVVESYDVIRSCIQGKDKNNHQDLFCVWLPFVESWVSAHPHRKIQKAAGMLQCGLSRLRQARGGCLHWKEGQPKPCNPSGKAITSLCLHLSFQKRQTAKNTRMVFSSLETLRDQKNFLSHSLHHHCLSVLIWHSCGF